ncbi:Hypothetical_protein [Hexamita inflata]|uniref:Hypothetical_protein n=1 Tax=Hexamita inflata TaxID=28002 RepID=A0AA86NCK6_9EUKA|nr:Hypothetical protein HINF_LOCUS4204 [Hexamita inflata]
MKKYSESEIKLIKYLLQHKDELHEDHLTLSFENISKQLKKEFEVQISRTTLWNYSRKINIGQSYKKKLQPVVEVVQKEEESVDESYEESVEESYEESYEESVVE